MSELAHFEESMTRTNVSNALRSESPDPIPTAISQFSKKAATLRDQAGFVNIDAARLHDDTLQLLLSSETDEKVKLGLKALLAELTEDHGLGWSDIARLVQVSVPAIRKWRTGGEITSARLHNLAGLAAFLKILADQEIADPAAWLATPISHDVDRSVTKASIYAAGHAVALLAYADHHINLEQLLKLVDVPADRMVQSTALVPGEDGSLSIVPLGS